MPRTTGAFTSNYRLYPNSATLSRPRALAPRTTASTISTAVPPVKASRQTFSHPGIFYYPASPYLKPPTLAPGCHPLPAAAPMNARPPPRPAAQPGSRGRRLQRRIPSRILPPRGPAASRRTGAASRPWLNARSVRGPGRGSQLALHLLQPIGQVDVRQSHGELAAGALDGASRLVRPAP